jgi:preprotein translocase subunit SecE
MFAKIANFFKEVRIELKKVTWPTRQETIRYTLLVIGVSAGVALFLGGLDYLFQFLLGKFVI